VCVFLIYKRFSSMYPTYVAYVNRFLIKRVM